MEVLVCGFDRGGFAEVDSDGGGSEEGRGVEELADGDGGFGGGE